MVDQIRGVNIDLFVIVVDIFLSISLTLGNISPTVMILVKFRANRSMATKLIDEQEFYTWLGSRVKEYRKKKKLTQEDLAQLSLLKRTTVTNIENGKQKSPLHVIVAICYTLEIELSDLIPSISDLLGSKVTAFEYINIGSTSKPVPKNVADIISRIQNDYQEE